MTSPGLDSEVIVGPQVGKRETVRLQTGKRGSETACILGNCAAGFDA